MKQFSLLLFLLLLISNHNLEAQVLTDSTVTMIAFWNLGADISYEVTQVEEKLEAGVQTTKSTIYDLKISVIDSTADNYLVRWSSSNVKTDYELEESEKIMMDLCADIPLTIKTGALGNFEGIEDWEGMADMFDEVMNRWLETKEEYPDTLVNYLKNFASSIMGSQEQANYWSREPRIFYQFYGVPISRTEEMEGVKFYTNPFLKTQMEGYQIVKLTDLDLENYIAVISSNSGIEGDKAKALMLDFFKQNSEQLGIESPEEISIEDMPEFSVEEETSFLFHIPTGHIGTVFHSRMVRLREDSKRTTYSFQLKD